MNLQSHKWFPIIHPTNIELKASEMLNKYIEDLEQCTEEEIGVIQCIFKDSMTNIALQLNQKL